MDAKRLVVLALVVTGTMGAIRELAHPKPGVKLPALRFVVGLTFAGVVLSALAEIQPKLAGGLAALMMTSSVLVGGSETFTAVNNLTKQR